jgi:hypothetical protein
MGLRLHGTYAAQGGLSIEFRSDKAQWNAERHNVAEGYAVQNVGGQMLITLQNGSIPSSVQLQPNGALAGSGMVNVAGR